MYQVLSDVMPPIMYSLTQQEAVKVLQRVLARSVAGTSPFYAGPIDGFYTAAVETGFRAWTRAANLNFYGMLAGRVTFPLVGLTAPVLRLIAKARREAGFGWFRLPGWLSR